MSDAKNILYATTRGWNVGDDFIRLGCERLMNKFFPEHNKIIYDKAPQIRKRDGSVWESSEFHANSVEWEKQCTMPFDVMVVAGTPENNNGRMWNFFKFGDSSTIRVALALGGNPETFSGKTIELLRSCKVVTTRSQMYLDGYRKKIGDFCQYLPCTSILCSNIIANPASSSIIALGWKNAQGASVSMTQISVENYNRMVALYRQLINALPNYKFEIVCHHIDEVLDAKKRFPNLAVRYSYNESDYEKIYCKYAFCVTPKVHGCGICASMGIPSCLLPVDHRADTAKGFLSRITWGLDEIVDEISNAGELHDQLVEHKEQTMAGYVDLLNIVF